MKYYAKTDMTMDEIRRSLLKISRLGRVIGPLSRTEKAAGGRISLHLGKKGGSFSFTHKAPGRYSAVPAVLRGRITDGGFTRRICWRVGKSRPRAALAAVAIAFLLASGLIRLCAGFYLSGAVLTVLSVLLFFVAFLPSREERELLRDDLYSILGAEDAQ